MRTYYRGPDAYVTDEQFVWLLHPSRVFAIRDLHDVVIVQRPTGPARTNVPLLIGGPAALAVAGWSLLGAGAIAVAIAVAVVALAATAVARQLRPARRELRASYRGVDVVLFASAETTTFGKVTRGLRRALETSGPTAIGYHLVS